MRIAALCLLVCCGGLTTSDVGTDTGTDAPTDTASDTLAEACGVQAANCTEAHAMLECTSDSGSAEGCLSDAGGCEGSDPSAVCTNQCTPNEYAAACGSPGPSSNDTPPSTKCRSVLITPGGVAFYCCPC
jgi:hypothetical protein